MNIKIDPEFRDLIPPLSDEELDNLHTSISLDGCLAPLIVWKQEGILLDGHNRYAFCKKCDYDFQVTEIKLPHRESAKNWIILNQLGRRNVSPDVAARLRGMLYISRKKEHGVRGAEKSGQSGHSFESKTRDEVANETGVSPRTIARDAAYAEACDTLGISTASIASGEEKRSRSEIIATAAVTKAATGITAASGARPDKVKPKRVVKTPYEKILALLPRLESKELQQLHQLLESKF
jgi:hypothetical protein